MIVKCFIRMCFLLVLLSFGTVPYAFSGDFSEEITIADRKVVLEQFDEAEKIYQKIISSSDFSVVVAYAHYKLGALFKRRNELAKAKAEYEKGLLSLKRAGKSNHQIGKYLIQAMEVSG